MATVTKLGPLDQGRSMTLDEFMAGDYEEGYQYELIDGMLSVSPLPNASEGLVDDWISEKLKAYARARPDIINWVYGKARVFVPGRLGVTNPEPDVSAYHNFPRDQDFRTLRWEDFSPILVVKILSPDDPNKDLIRNVALYLQVPSIKEYWILDPRQSPDEPTLHVYRRLGKRWRKPIVLAYGDRYTTKLLPGFELLLDPHS